MFPLMPETPARVADLGCGTGSLSLRLAKGGYRSLASTSHPRW
jgi:16S rRNA G1207 methylase RsmC